MVLSAGVEPTLLVPETSVLSIELREQGFCDILVVIISYFGDDGEMAGRQCELDVAEGDFLDFLNDGFNFFEVKEIRGDGIGGEGDDGDDAEFGENGKEGFVGGHEGEEFGHGIGDAAGDDSGKEHAAHGSPERFGEEFSV